MQRFKFNEHVLCLFHNWLLLQFWNLTRSTPLEDRHQSHSLENQIRGTWEGGKHSVKHHLWLSIIVPRLKNGFWQQAICATQLQCSNAEFGITADSGHSQTPLSGGEIWWSSPKSHDQSFCPILLTDYHLLVSGWEWTPIQIKSTWLEMFILRF